MTKLESPRRIERAYARKIIRPFITIGKFALSAARSTVNAGAVRDFEDRALEYILENTHSGIDGTGAYNDDLAGDSTKTIRNAVLATEAASRSDFVRLANGVGRTIQLTRAQEIDYLEYKIFENIQLVRGAQQEELEKLKNILTETIIAPEKTETLVADIRNATSSGQSRAVLIAENETSNIYADLRDRRFNRIGVREYMWSSSGDSSVRTLHRALDGVIYKVGEPTDAEQGLPPGRPIRCRCVAIPIFED